MTKVRKTQLLLIVAAVVLSVLLYFAPKNSGASARENLAENSGKNTETIEVFVKAALGTLSNDLKPKAENKNLDSIISFWDKNKRPDIASFYFEKQMAKTNKAVNWFKAGDRYYYSVRFIKDPDETPILYASAMRCYENGLKLDPNNADAKIMLASCLVEGSPDPMKGITMLREIEKTDSNNITLQLNFAFFSVRSQQWDKAIKRFEKVIQIDSTYIEAYLHLADAYEQSGQKNKTIEVLEKYKSKTEDALTKQEIDKYIQQLKINLNK
ncbi:MAG TPA: tetratricopeptide repeat protein [Bacteroidia bacterium]|jgi:tetratricopeptide (TPR) repeat protein|nr:tetratricopeptide repeat protein [Bacteroidia bacterium]